MSQLPESLFYAYQWTDAAGELDELRMLTGDALAAYCRDSVANHADNRDPDGDWKGSLTESDLESLRDWLRGGDE